MSFKINLTQEQEDLFKHGTLIRGIDSDYLFFPFWIEKKSDGSFIAHDFSNLPAHLQEIIRERQEYLTKGTPSRKEIKLPHE